MIWSDKYPWIIEALRYLRVRSIIVDAKSRTLMDQGLGTSRERTLVASEGIPCTLPHPLLGSMASLCVVLVRKFLFP
jgi:hypothetical protein